MPCWQELPKIIVRATTRANGFYGHIKTICEKEKQLECPTTVTEDYIRTEVRFSGFMLPFAGNVVRCSRSMRSVI